MATSSADVNSQNSVGTTLEQFRSALTRPVARRNMGLRLTDQKAQAIAADTALAAGWYKLWRVSVLPPPPDGLRGPRSDPIVLPHTAIDAPPPHAPVDPERPPPAHVPESLDEWQERLPVRFNPPPGWPEPPPDWILAHIGLEMSDAWRPPGAPTIDPPGWLWWVPQEPAWTAWVHQHSGAADMLRTARIVCGVCVGLTLSFFFLGWTLGWVLAGVAAFGSGVGWQLTEAHDRHFRRDPLGELRDHHLQVAEMLRIGGPVRDGHHLDMSDYWDGGGDGGGGFDF